MRILISGAGIAGPALAYWLAHYGFQPTLVEVAPHLRSGGYVIDFWGAGFDVAERMGILPEVLNAGYRVRELRVVNRDGKQVAGFPVDAFFRITHGRYTSLPRSALSAAIFRAIADKVETIFGDSVEAIEQTSQDVHVAFRSGAARDFDLVIGAGGLHSKVRDLTFGPDRKFEKYLGFKAAAFEIEGYRPRDELVYVMYTEVGQQVARFTMRDDRTLILFTFADDDASIPASLCDQKALLRKRFGNGGWECPQILQALDASDQLYFDRVSQIRMDSEPGLWTRDRVSLIGDAAFCVSLLAGQGCALAMTAAYILAGELHRANGDYREAFRRYQSVFAPFVRGKQDAALRFANAFAPRSKWAIFVRNQIFNLLRIGWVSNLAFGNDLADKITLPEY